MTFCAAPFVHMVQNPDGQYRTCCMYEKPLTGNYANIKDAFDSEENKIIRERMLSGEKLEECIKCDIDEMHEGKTRLSYRNEFNSLYKKYINNPSFRTLEISVSNKCNFKCVDCGPRFSNQFGPTITNNLPDANNYKDLEFLKILGGEPFLDNKNVELIKQVPRHNIKLMLVTNNSIFPNTSILELLSEFKHLNINISIDGIREVAEYVRPGTKWTRFERNWIKWMRWKSEKRGQCYVNPHFVFHNFNSTFFDETLEWSNITLDNWSWDFLVMPEHLNMSYLPDRVKEFILHKNKNLKKPLEKFLGLNSYNKTFFKLFLSRITNIPDQMEEFVDLCFREI
tara:strand:+ start:1288 stop:2307 length:1020 start_codon:yes stop_codon:yes gene_type:complete